MALLLRYVADTWQVVATVPAYDNIRGYNPDAILPIASVESLVTAAGVTAQPLFGFTSRLKTTEYKGANGWYSAEFSSSAPTGTDVTNETTAVTTPILSVLEATVGGVVTVSRVLLVEGPPPTPFWTAFTKTVELQ